MNDKVFEISVSFLKILCGKKITEKKKIIVHMMSIIAKNEKISKSCYQKMRIIYSVGSNLKM